MMTECGVQKGVNSSVPGPFTDADLDLDLVVAVVVVVERCPSGIFLV